jgi:hypothetical protein
MKRHMLLALGVALLPRISALPTQDLSSLGASSRTETHPVLARDFRDLIRSVSILCPVVVPRLLLLTNLQLEEQLGIAAGGTSGMDVATILNLLAARDDDLLFRRRPKAAMSA